MWKEYYFWNLIYAATWKQCAAICFSLLLYWHQYLEWLENKWEKERLKQRKNAASRFWNSSQAPHETTQSNELQLLRWIILGWKMDLNKKDGGNVLNSQVWRITTQIQQKGSEKLLYEWTSKQKNILKTRTWIHKNRCHFTLVRWLTFVSFWKFDAWEIRFTQPHIVRRITFISTSIIVMIHSNERRWTHHHSTIHLYIYTEKSVYILKENK